MLNGYVMEGTHGLSYMLNGYVMEGTQWIVIHAKWVCYGGYSMDCHRC